MRADELDTAARLRARCRKVIDDLRGFGIPNAAMSGRSLFELEEMRHARIARLMSEPPTGLTTPAFHRKAHEQRSADIAAAKATAERTDILLDEIDGLFADLLAHGRLVWP